MKILIVTGQFAEEAVRKAVAKFDFADVLVLPTAVAALITPQQLIQGYRSSAFSQKTYDAVLVSGFSKFHFERAEKEIGSPIFLGPKHAADLKSISERSAFSKTVPACELAQMEKAAQAFDILKEAACSEVPALMLKSVSVGGNSRMKILAEIVAAESLSEKELLFQINLLMSEGADIIDLGFSPDADEKAVFSVVSYARSVCPLPVSADAGTFSQICSGVRAGADLILSADSRILEAYAQLPPDQKEILMPAFEKTAFVVIPDLFSNEAPLKTLEQNLFRARELGLRRLIADPILSPPGRDFLPSLKRYSDFHKRFADVPLLFGAGNVTELFDADSVGINALLSEIAKECGASVLFTPYASDKCKGSVRELKKASEMMIVSSARHSSPKDLGVDLLCLKEKKKRPDFNLALLSHEEAFQTLHLRTDETAQHSLPASSGFSENPPFSSRPFFFSGTLHPEYTPEVKWGWKTDPFGNFLIGVVPADELAEYLIRQCGRDPACPELQKLREVPTPGNRLILAAHQNAVILGIDSAFMLDALLKAGLISELSHAGYLGRELQKAEIAVFFGRSYAQDDVF